MFEKHAPFYEIMVPPRMEPTPISLVEDLDYKKSNKNTSYFKKGSLYKIKPRDHKLTLDEDRGKAYNARYIVSDGIKYDLENPESIKKIKIPKFTSTFLTRDLGYLLRMCAGNEIRTELTVPLAYKAVSLMIASPIAFSKKDYFSIIAHLWTLGEIKYADYLLEEVNKRIPNIMSNNYVDVVHKNAFHSTLQIARDLGEDYLLSGDSRCVCAESAPYCNRIYCISGKDNKFPKIPDFILERGGLPDVDFYAHFYYPGEKITIYEYDTDGNVTEKEVDAIKHSNRPFKDDRNKFEKEIYEKHLLKHTNDTKREEKYFNRESWIEKYYGKLEYNEILKLLPNKAPKSFSGYMRMRNNNSDNFKKLVDSSSKLGVKFYT